MSPLIMDYTVQPMPDKELVVIDSTLLERFRLYGTIPETSKVSKVKYIKLLNPKWGYCVDQSMIVLETESRTCM